MAENCAEPCLVRCDADELTYPLHIVIRYEIEQLLFSGEASAKDVPGLWNERYKSYLGLDVPTYSSGCLQDTHWSDGDFGYFPTYALGSAFGAQLKVAMIDDGVDFDGACASGDLAPIREWLRTRIWTWGRARDAGELMRAQRVRAAEIRTEMQVVKWAAEGALKAKASRTRRKAYVSCQRCEGIS